MPTPDAETQIDFSDVAVTFKQALHQHVNVYFENGGAFTLGDKSITFPAADLVYDLRLIDTPSRLTISFIGDDIFNEKVLKVNNPNTGGTGKPGVEIWADVERSVYISSPLMGANGPNRRLVESTWGKLYVVFAANWSAFAEHNIIRPTLSVFPEEIRERPTIVTAYGLLKAKVRFQMARYNQD